jgi:hypothetical protein
MRSLALLLLLANISFLGWQLNQFPWLPWQPEHVIQPSPTGKLAISNLPQLVLLQEYQQSNLNSQFPPQQLDTPVNLAMAESSADNPQKNSTLTKVVTNFAEDPTQEIEKAQPPPDDISEKPRRTTESLTQLAASKTVNDRSTVIETAEQSHAEKLTVTAATTLTGASQLQQAVKLSAEQPPPKIEPSPINSVQPVNKATQTTNRVKSLTTAATEQEVICLESGPYAQAAMAQPLYKWLKNKLWLKNKAEINRDISVEIQPRQTQVLESTWVYLPPFKNRQAAYVAQQRLNQLGIVDYMIVTRGQFNNAISLGRYRNPRNVQQRLKELSAKGYQNIKTQERYRSNTRYWLNVKILPKESHSLLSAFEKRFKNLTLKPVNCESIAKAG